MIAAEIYSAREKLGAMFPTLDFLVVRSGHRYRHFVVGVRPKGNDGIHVWMWTPMDDFPDATLRTQLMLIA